MTKIRFTAEQFNAWLQSCRLTQGEVAELFTSLGYPIGQTGVSWWTRYGVPHRAASTFVNVAQYVEAQREQAQLTELAKSA